MGIFPLPYFCYKWCCQYSNTYLTIALILWLIFLSVSFSSALCKSIFLVQCKYLWLVGLLQKSWLDMPLILVKMFLMVAFLFLNSSRLSRNRNSKPCNEWAYRLLVFFRQSLVLDWCYLGIWNRCVPAYSSLIIVA